MEGLGWWIYLCSVAGGIGTVSLMFLILCTVAAVVTFLYGVTMNVN